MNKGIYLLFFELLKDSKIKIGKLGSFRFRKGRYVYVGSAMKNLDQRIERHLKKRKKKFWHIDYLLSSKNVDIYLIVRIETKKKIECEVAKILADMGEVVVKGFGSSDCRCDSHLIYLGK